VRNDGVRSYYVLAKDVEEVKVVGKGKSLVEPVTGGDVVRNMNLFSGCSVLSVLTQD